MSAETRTLDELLAEAGISREEWQRGRKVYEGYWEEIARINGWAPKQEHEPTTHMSLPLSVDCWATLKVTRPMTEDDYTKLMELLTLMKSGLTTQEKQ